MTDAVVVLFLTAFVISSSIVHCSILKRQVIPQNLKNFAGLAVKRISPTTVSVSWNPGGKGEFRNVFLEFRRSGDANWQNLEIRNDSTSNSQISYSLILPNPCSAYEIRLRVSDKNGTVSETVSVPIPSISNRIDPIRPVITKNRYENLTDTIDLEFSIENHSLASWPSEWRHLTTDVHVVECGPFAAPVPSVRWVSDSKAVVRFPSPYVESVKSGHACKILISIREPSKICDQALKIVDELLDDAILVDMNCADTENIQCPESKRRHVPSLRCNPEFVDASQFISDENLKSAYEFRVRWEFEKNGTVDRTVPRKIMLRFGYTDVPVNADQILAVLAPMREIDRFEVDGAIRNGTFRTNKTVPDLVHEKEPLQRFHRISVCAIYGEGDSDERIINWAIIPTFSVKTVPSAPKIDAEPEKQCRCDEFSTKDAETTHTRTSPTPPPIVSSPSHQYENFWTKVAPLLAVFSVMTVINLILLMASYYYYKKAKRLNAVK